MCVKNGASTASDIVNQRVGSPLHNNQNSLYIDILIYRGDISKYTNIVGMNDAGMDVKPEHSMTFIVNLS